VCDFNTALTRKNKVEKSHVLKLKVPNYCQH